MSGSSAAWQAMTLARALRAAAQRNPGKLAMVQGADSRTCGELGTRIDALRNAAITKLGVRKGDNVAIVSRNCFEFIEVVTALPDAGAAVAMVNPRGAPPEMTATLDDCGATVLFADAPSAEFARSSGRRVIVFGPEYEALLAGAVAPSELPQIEEWDAWTIPYTSGTTGKPKGMSPGQAVTIAMLGNLVVLVPILLIGHAGAKYGIPFPVLARASFGTIGARLPALARALVALAVFWLAQLVFIEKGILAIRKFETWTAPLKVVVCIALVWWAVSNAGGLGPIWSQPPAFEPGGAKAGQFWVVFWPMFTAMSGYWGALALNIPDFTRFAHSQKDQLVGQAAGLPEPMAALALMSVVVTSATVVIYGEAIWDPVALAGNLAGVGVPIGLLVITIDTTSVNIAANLVGPAYDVSSLWPSRISYRVGGYITAIIGTAIMPWKLLESTQGYIFVWLTGYGALLGPIAGIMIADYWIVRRSNLNLDALYEAEGEYRYARGWNPVALIAFAVPVAINLPGFLHSAFPATFAGTPPLLVRLYDWAWFIGVLLALLIYAVLQSRKHSA